MGALELFSLSHTTLRKIRDFRFFALIQKSKKTAAKTDSCEILTRDLTLKMNSIQLETKNISQKNF